jgi:phosphate butyryltransferase
MTVKTFDELITMKFGGKKRKLAVVCADSEHTLEGVIRAYKAGLIHPILIGDGAKIKAILHNLAYEGDDMEMIEAKSKEAALDIMVDMAKNNQINAIMKGNMDTKDILGAVVKKENEMTETGVMNSITFSMIPSYHKLLMVADPGMIIQPTLEQKVGIIHNCLKAFRALAYEKPKVAILSCIEKVNPKIESTMHASALMDMADAGVFGECDLYGPLSYDLIVNKEAAEIKGVSSDVCGDADLIVVPDINTGNTLVKSHTYTAGAIGGGAVLGAKIPVIVPSRASSTNGKYYAIVVGCALQ